MWRTTRKRDPTSPAHGRRSYPFVRSWDGRGRVFGGGGSSELPTGPGATRSPGDGFGDSGPHDVCVICVTTQDPECEGSSTRSLVVLLPCPTLGSCPPLSSFFPAPHSGPVLCRVSELSHGGTPSDGERRRQRVDILVRQRRQDRTTPRDPVVRSVGGSGLRVCVRNRTLGFCDGGGRRRLPGCRSVRVSGRTGG